MLWFQHTGFGNRFQSFAMRNLRNDDRNGVEDVRHWHIYPEKQLLFLNAVMHTPHISVLHNIFWTSTTKEQYEMSKFEVLWRLGQDTTQLNFSLILHS